MLKLGNLISLLGRYLKYSDCRVKPKRSRRGVLNPVMSVIILEGLKPSGKSTSNGRPLWVQYQAFRTLMNNLGNIGLRNWGRSVIFVLGTSVGILWETYRYNASIYQEHY